MDNVLHTVFHVNESESENESERESERENEKYVAYCGHQCSIFWLHANDKNQLNHSASSSIRIHH